MIQSIEFFEILVKINNENNSIVEKYSKMRSLLERICNDLTSTENIQFSNLFSRLDYVCEKKHLSRRKKFQIHRFRLNANNVLYSNFKPTEDNYKQDLKALCNVINFFYKVDIPNVLLALMPKNDYYKPESRPTKKHDRIRISVLSINNQYIYASDEENPTEEPIKIKHHIQENEKFNETIAQLWKGCQLNLIDVTVDEQGVYIPDLIILEPDYLIDISSLAECVKEYGTHPLNYVQSKFEATKNTKHILLGNVANLFLDELLNKNEPVVYHTSIKKAFRLSPFEFSTCKEIDRKFFDDAESQFNNIKNVVDNVFQQQKINRENAILEPSFICEHLGVQGRLDFLQLQPNNDGKKFVIELKSGKAPFPETDFSKIGLNHQSQAFIYQIILQKILGIKFGDLQTYILYSKYAAKDLNLRLSRPYMAAIKEILNIRNLIVVNESRIVRDKQEIQTKEIIKSIIPQTLIANSRANERFINQYIIPQINGFKSVFDKASALELEYFHSFYSFVTKEHYLSKIGSIEHESVRGISSLWLSQDKDKQDAGEILFDLTIRENKADEANIKLQIPNYDQDFLPNFRQGDIVILYERNKETDNVTNKQIFKGAIEELTPDEITVHLRYKQNNKSIFPSTSKYAVEHDFLDSSYNSMYRALYAFLQANQDRKDLLLNQRQPSQNTVNYCESITDPIQQIVHKAVMARDYFLLVGPPGTGKTSMALKSMVEEFYSNPENNILLLSYTNRAVDEICGALDKVEKKPDYIRIGSELSCEENYRKRLLEKIIKDCNKRDEVKEKIEACRIFAGTVASISNKTELFKLKHFQVAIVDEASQILEPHIIGILSAKDIEDKNAIDKFILIGDHKQLPAVVLQKEEETRVNNTILQQIGLTDRRNSLFERLYNLHKADKKSLVWEMLYKQGRMHPIVAEFPNTRFYDNKLETVPCEHQEINELEYKQFDDKNPFHALIAKKRIAFIPSEKYDKDQSNKTNTYEARIVKKLVENIYELYTKNNIEFKLEETIGIITPYRSQIALIKREIHSLNISELNDITVDTVERFQGSQRDIIIYSFCVNEFYQLDFLASNTIIDEKQTIDRKLNVAITRARKQLFITGNPSILWNNSIYYNFIEFIRSKFSYIYAKPEDFLDGKFEINSESETESNIESIVSELETDNYRRAIQSFNNLYFKKIIDIVKNNCFQQCPGKNLCLPWYGHDHGKDLLTSHQNLCKYLCAYGEMHEAKMKVACNAIPDFILQQEFSIVDWGCGQALATVCFFDFLNQKQIQNRTQKVILIEPSEMALERAKLHTNAYLRDENKIEIINKYLNDVKKEDIQTNTPITLHFFSNILDISSIDLEKLSEKISAEIFGKHYLICVGPLNSMNNRIDVFFRHFQTAQLITKEASDKLINVNGWRSVKYLIFEI